jgi:uncharacterized protein YbcC (UPF0753/DUF2309 family)
MQEIDLNNILHKLKHYLPSQNPLKDFVHHNTLHAFQHQNFHEGIQSAAEIFGYQVYLTLNEFRNMFSVEKINIQVLNRVISEKKGAINLAEWKNKLLYQNYDEIHLQYIGKLRNYWKSSYKINLDKYVHPTLFRVLGAFLDQGISNNKFPNYHLSFLEALKCNEKKSHISLFQTERAKKIIHENNALEKLLQLIVGDSELIEHYLFDQQFAHPGWSGMASVLEDNPESLLDTRKISLRELITFELLLELDMLDREHGEIWKPISESLPEDFDKKLFGKKHYNELFEVYSFWQEAYEWSYYDEVLKGLQLSGLFAKNEKKSFQAAFCIDDRECSYRRYLEKNDNYCETFSTAGFFNISFYFQPENGKFYTKCCPVPAVAKHLIKEQQAKNRVYKESNFNRHTHGFFGGWITAPTIGFWSAFKMIVNILYPNPSPTMVSSFEHMDKNGQLSIEHQNQSEKQLQIGFTTKEMAEKVEGLLKGIGLLKDFANLVYFIGHGASSINNTHYAGYDCGACSGRAGSVNARVAAFMANKLEVRLLLKQKGIDIPEETQFVGGLHDTTRDEVAFFDEEVLSTINQTLHKTNKAIFEKSLCENAKERSRRFLLMNSKADAKKVHEKVKLRSFSLFEPRPEWNHATNTLCIIGKRENNKHLFLDRRAFLNSYDYSIDTDGCILLGILNAIAPVCGGINLEYYFSRIDNYRLGAGSKLPHNVMGLIGVANGMDGDLRTGLPKQMINIHDPLRLLVIIEHYPEEVFRILKINPNTYEWFVNAWIHLVVIHPKNKLLFVFKNETFEPYIPLTKEIKIAEKMEQLFEQHSENLPIYTIA